MQRALGLAAIVIPLAIVVGLAVHRREPAREPPRALPVEIAPSADPRLVLEVRDATYEPDDVELHGIVANRGDVTFIAIGVHLDLLDEQGATVGSLDVEPVDFSSPTGWLWAGFQVGFRNDKAWDGDWREPAKLRARVSRAEVERGEPPPPQPTLSPIAVRATRPAPPNTTLAIDELWGGDGPAGIGPSAGLVVFDLGLAVTDRGTTDISSADLRVIFEDDAGHVVDTLQPDASFAPPLKPGDRRYVGIGRGVHAHARWHVELGEIRLAR